MCFTRVIKSVTQKCNVHLSQLPGALPESSAARKARRGRPSLRRYHQRRTERRRQNLRRRRPRFRRVPRPRRRRRAEYGANSMRKTLLEEGPTQFGRQLLRMRPFLLCKSAGGRQIVSEETAQGRRHGKLCQPVGGFVCWDVGNFDEAPRLVGMGSQDYVFLAKKVLNLFYKFFYFCLS